MEYILGELLSPMLLIGSRALALRYPQIPRRVPVDFDYIATEEEYHAFDRSSVKAISTRCYPDGKRSLHGDSIVEFEFNPEALVLEDTNRIYSPVGDIPSLNFLFMLKTSHRYKKNSPHFWKTLLDWHTMRAAGATILPAHASFLKAREVATYNYKHPSLNRNKSEFFSGDGVQYVYEHDDIHRAVALDGAPAYTKYADPKHDVRSSKERFFYEVSEQTRINGVIEEACTLAIERSLVPYPGKATPKQAWMFALSKVLTSITSGWFRQYGYENAPKVVAQYPESYYDRFQMAVKAGQVARV